LLFEIQGLSFAFWIFLAFVAGLVANWLIRSGSAEKIRSRLDRGDKAFFRGVQHILSNEPDRAIEQFTKSVQINSETIETYVALANLYSSAGDIERAIRIRQGIILRPNLDSAIRLRAIFDLGSDYKRGGVLDRALSAFQKVIESEPNNLEAHEQIERIYEDLHDWDRAFKTRQTISKLVKGDHRHILAHHKTELAKVREKDGDEVSAEKAYKEAISIFDGCVDAYLHLGDLYLSQQRHKAALAKWKKVVDVAPEFTFLAYQRLERAYAKMDNPGLVGDFLKEVARQNSDVSTQLALARYLYNEGEVDAAVDQVRQAIKLAPSFLDARKFIGEVLLKEGRNEEALVAYKELLLSLDFPFLQFRCNNCGYRPEKLAWRCPQCLKWDSIGIIEPPPLSLPNGHSPS
jgi:lipopolysaccharide biosynthesis regulator YciM